MSKVEVAARLAFVAFAFVVLLIEIASQLKVRWSSHEQLGFWWWEPRKYWRLLRAHSKMYPNSWLRVAFCGLPIILIVLVSILNYV